MTRDRIIEIIKGELTHQGREEGDAYVIGDLLLKECCHNDINDWDVEGVIHIDNIADAIMKEIDDPWLTLQKS